VAELTKLEDKLGEVLGLAKAAQGATAKVAKLVDDAEIAQVLQRMGQEAAETEQRCTELAGSIEGKKTAILEKARETKGEATEMMAIYLGDDAEGLDGLEFLTMAEAGEVGHWEILGTLGERAAERRVQELVGWALPIQERHLAQVRESSLKLAAEEDPNEAS
jgi:hypothetical protein